jgi:hypothetical protein
MATRNVDFNLSVGWRPSLFVDVVVTAYDVVLDTQQRRPNVSSVQRKRILEKIRKLQSDED